MDMKVEHAYQRSIETVANWIQTELNSSKTQVFFRTYSPVHFRFVLFLKQHNLSSTLKSTCIPFPLPFLVKKKKKPTRTMIPCRNRIKKIK